MTHSPTPSLTLSQRWMIVGLVVGYAAIAHFNRVGISVAGSEVFIRKTERHDPSKEPLNPSPQLSQETKNHAFAKTFTETEMGWVYTAFLIVYTLAMMPGGWLVDHIGTGKSLTLLGLTMGTFVALTGVLGWLMSTPHQLWMGLLIVRGCAGFCSAPLHPAAAHVVSEVTPENGRTTANGLVVAGALLGIAFSYPLFGLLIDRISWPFAFIACGVTMMTYALIWRQFAAPMLTARHVQLSSSTVAEDSASLPELPSARWAVLRRSDLWLITLSYMAFGYFQFLFFYWMTYYFENVLHVSNIQSRQAAFFISLAQCAGMVLGGLSTDTICRVLGTIRGRQCIVFIGMGLSGLLALIAVTLVKDYLQVVIWIALAMGAQGMCEGVFWTTVTEIAGKARGFAAAFMNTGGNVGGFISPVFTPFIAEAIGWPGAIAFACMISAVGGAIWLWIRPPSQTVSHLS